MSKLLTSWHEDPQLKAKIALFDGLLVAVAVIGVLATLAFVALALS